MDSIIFKNINRDDYHNSNAIDNAISYIYRVKEKSQLPIYCYGCLEWPPTYKRLVKEYHLVRETAETNLIDQQIIHFIISFGISVADITDMHMRFADDIAKLFRMEYQICYSYHTNTGHPHFHYVVSTTSYIPGNPPLERNRMSQYESQIQNLANTYGFEFHIEGVNGYV